MNRDQINLYWLVRLRWAAALGQALTILFTQYVLGIDIAVEPLLGIVALGVLSNLVFVVWFPEARGRSENVAERSNREYLLGALLILDLLWLTALLYGAGGPANPFSVFYIVGISLSAAVLRSRWAWVLALLSVGCFGLLFIGHIPVAALEHHAPHVEAGDPHAHHEDGAAIEAPMALHLKGMLIAFAGAAFFVAYFVSRVRTELDRRDAQLAEVERRRSKAERLDSLITMAAGAAHELASPLAAIAVAARELEVRPRNELSSDDTADDIRMIREEVERCRTILSSLSTQAGTSMGEAWVSRSASELLGAAIDELPDAKRIELSLSDDNAKVRVRTPHQAVTQAIRSLIKNAIEASPQTKTVSVYAVAEGDSLHISIHDHGKGIPAEVLDRIGEPFLTTKPAGSGMGLGLFHAKRVLEQIGGALAIRESTQNGTVIDLLVPLDAIDLARSDATGELQ